MSKCARVQYVFSAKVTTSPTVQWLEGHGVMRDKQIKLEDVEASLEYTAKFSFPGLGLKVFESVMCHASSSLLYYLFYLQHDAVSRSKLQRRVLRQVCKFFFKKKKRSKHQRHVLGQVCKICGFFVDRH